VRIRDRDRTLIRVEENVKLRLNSVLIVFIVIYIYNQDRKIATPKDISIPCASEIIIKLYLKRLRFQSQIISIYVKEKLLFLEVSSGRREIVIKIVIR